MNKKLRVNLQTKVNASAIDRKNIDGKEYIILSSATLPDNVEMNGITYEANEIEATYHTLEGAPAPLGHPQINGEYVSALEIEAFEEYHVGAVNKNVTRSNGRVMLEKWVNVQYAMRSDKGKRLLDAIRNMEKTGEPIHTSTGIFMEIEERDGKRYARNMQFDHDAILLDEQGAATPNQGVGIGVNSNGDKIDVMTVNLDIDYPEPEKTLFEKFKTWALSQKFDTDEKLTHNNIETTNEGDAMRELLIKALAVNADITDDALADELSKKLDAANKADAAVKTVAELTTKFDALADKFAANEAAQEAAEKSQKAELAKTLDITDEEAAAMSVNTLQKMADKLNKSTSGLSGGYRANAQSDVDYTMPSVEGL